MVVQSAGGYAPFNQKIVHQQLAGQAIVAGWSEYAFTQLPIDGQLVPVLGVQRQAGSVQPPTISGQPLSSGDQIELGTQTLAQLGKKAGDSVQIGTGATARRVTITGTVTLPSYGLATADHVSLGRARCCHGHAGRGRRQGNGQAGGPAAVGAVFPSAVAIDLAPGTTRAERDRLS